MTELMCFNYVDKALPDGSFRNMPIILILRYSIKCILSRAIYKSQYEQKLRPNGAVVADH